MMVDLLAKMMLKDLMKGVLRKMVVGWVQQMVGWMDRMKDVGKIVQMVVSSVY